MKNFIGLFLISSFAFAGLAFASDAPFQGVEWIGFVLQWIQSVPKVGPVVSEILQIVGSVAALGVVLVTFAQGLAAIPYIVLKVSGAQEKADKFKAKADKVINVLKWISLHNVKK